MSIVVVHIGVVVVLLALVNLFAQGRVTIALTAMTAAAIIYGATLHYRLQLSILRLPETRVVLNTPCLYLQ